MVLETVCKDIDIAIRRKMITQNLKNLQNSFLSVHPAETSVVWQLEAITLITTLYRTALQLHSPIPSSIERQKIGMHCQLT